jgi:hypothetical protein
MLLSVAMLLVVSKAVYAVNFAPIIKEQPHSIYHVVKNKTLLAAVNQLANRAGITFKLSATLKNDLVNLKLAADDWKAALAQLLKGYNYTTVLESGAIKTVMITGNNGNGHDNLITAEEEKLLTVVAPDAASQLPTKYKAYKPGSVFELNLPMNELAKIPLGKDVVLDLPMGQYKVRHDNLVDHGDGASTWIGYLNEEGKGYRVYLSQGDTGLMGNIYTPDGAYNIETVDGVTVIVDLERSGLQNTGFESDEHEPETHAFMAASMKVADKAKTAKAALTKSRSKKARLSARAYVTSGNVVDLMVLYTTNKQTASYAKHRIKYLVAVSNQAFADSGINMSLRLVHTRPTTYVESNANAQALADLASNRGAFKGTAGLRNKYGADLVMLFRPLYAQTAGSCGSTYVGFANGSGGVPDYGYGTIGDGSSKDALSGYYCGPNTFTHEIGHSLGNVHDRANSSYAGMFPHSYAWGVNNVFGTIMSLYGPPIMLFSNPNLTAQCAGMPCGYPAGDANASDQATTINYTAPIVGNYKPTKVKTPVIQ